MAFSQNSTFNVEVSDETMKPRVGALRKCMRACKESYREQTVLVFELRMEVLTTLPLASQQKIEEALHCVSNR